MTTKAAGSPAAAPLERFRVVGVVEKTTVVNAGTAAARAVAAGSCWHCGASIRICVRAENLVTGEIVDIGTTCAERIGLDAAELKEHLAERFAEQRRLASKAHREQQAAVRAQLEAELERTVGPHGTLARFEYEVAEADGWACADCRNAAPHGTTTKFWDGRCSCRLCLDAVLASNRSLYVGSRPVLVDLATGRPAAARLVNGRYGTSWLVTDPPTSRGHFVPASSKRRATITARGYTYARADFLLERSHSIRCPDVTHRRLTDPTEDDWGEPIVRPTEGARR